MNKNILVLSTINNIKPHPYNNNYDIICVENNNVVVIHNQYTLNELVFYIYEDTDVTLNINKFEYQKHILFYLKNNNIISVKNINNILSIGAVFKVTPNLIYLFELCKNTNDIYDKFGLKHHNSYCKNMLPWNIQLTHELNWYQLKQDDFIIGEKCLITKKIDGVSMSVFVDINGNIMISDRYKVIKFTNSTIQYFSAVFSYLNIFKKISKYLKQKIVFRGELTSKNISPLKINNDKYINNGKPTFHLFNCYFPDLQLKEDREGRYGSKYHFLKIVKLSNQILNFNINTVPIIGESIISYDLFQKYTNMNHTFGEGVVLNFYSGIGSCKIKSLDYIRCNTDE